MLRAYAGAGFDPGAFWGLTPKLYVAHMRGAGDRVESSVKAGIQAAWINAVLSRAKTIPPLEKLLDGKAAVKHQTKEELQAMFDVVTAVWGK